MSRRLLLVAALVLVLAVVVPGRAGATASPAGLTAFALDAAVDLAWQPVTGASAYNVYRGLSPGAVTTLISPVGGVAATGFTDSGAVDGTTYYYVVKPIVGGFEAGSSLTVQAAPRVRSCATGNPVVLENCFPGDAGWKVTGALAASAGGIEGFATAPSINRAGSVDLKVDTAASTTFHVEIYRSGWYGGAGARLVSVVRAVQGTAQPSCTGNSSTGLHDCSNWSTSLTITTSASWPTGIYLLRLVRDDNGSDSHVVLVVRDDARASGLLYTAGFTTWEAYNNYGGKSLYSFNSTGSNTVAGTPRAVKVSFDRPFIQPRDASIPNWYPRDELPMVSWLESQGYDVGYASDSDLETSPVGSHKALMASAHDEYWSAAMRSAVKQARDAGVGLFFSGSNTSYWKIRFENGPNGGANRVEVCYKTVESGPADPSGIPTTLWREPAVAQPENALIGEYYVGDKTGTYFPLVVSASEGTDRSWRYTGLDNQAPGTSTSIGAALVGWEWDARDTANGAEPAGVKTLATSSATGNVLTSNYTYTTGTVAPNVTRYTAASGALVFATGTNHWDWGLAYDADGNGEPDRRIQQATTNVLEDLGLTPATPSANLTLDSATAPRVASTSPADGATGVLPTAKVTATFSRAMDATTITSSSFTLKKPDGSAVAATVTYDAASATATLTPSTALAFSTQYTARLDTTVKAADGTPLQTANAWVFVTKPPQNPVYVNAGGPAFTSSSGAAYLADQYFSGGNVNSTTAAIGGTPDPALYQNERWGQFSYAIPVVNGTYDVTFRLVELYYAAPCSGKRIFSLDVLNTPTSPDLPNIDICARAGGPNRALNLTVYAVPVTGGVLNVKSVYGSADDPEVAAIDVVPSTGPPPPPTVTQTTPVDGATGVASSVGPTATFSRAMDASTLTSASFTLTAQGSATPVAASVAYDPSTSVATLTPASALANSTTYTAKVDTTAKASDGAALANAVTWSFTTAASTPPGTTVRINTGGPAYTAADGRVFSADQSFSGGSTFTSAAAISGTSDPALYQNERWGSFSYAIPVTNGTYDVTFHFVELYYTAGSCIAKRVFSMDITNTPASPDIASLDICAAAGGANKAYDKTISGVQVSNGVLTIQSVYGSADDPEVAAIEVVPSGPPDTQPPSAPGSLTASGSLGQVSLAWSASTDNVGVVRYDVYRSTTSGFTPAPANRVGQPTGTSFTDSGLAAGSYYYKVQAEDAAGNLSPASNEASATVTADTTPPSVAISSPAGGATVSNTITVSASASDNVAVAGVQFKVDGNNIDGEITSTPYQVSWTTNTLANGPHTLTAVARDTSNNTATSAPVTVTVANNAPAGLVAAYNFDAGSGSSVADLSGNGNTGTISNATWTTSGHSGNALSFNGSNAWVTVPDTSSLDLTNALTLEAWVNPSALGTAWRNVLFKEQPGEMIYSLYANQNTTRPIGQIYLGGERNAIGTSALALNAWTHLTLSWDGSNLRLYINATLTQTTPATGTLPTSTGPLHIGGDAVWGEWFKGTIDDIRLYNRALTQTEIQTDMNTPVR